MSHFSPAELWCWSGLAAVTLIGTPVLAQQTAESTAQSSELVVLQLAPEGADRESEARLVRELELVLDGFVIRTEALDDEEEFLSLTLSEQLNRLRPITARPQVKAVTWLLREESSEFTLLHLVALSTGRALVRIVEAQHGLGEAEELALSTRELLGEAYLFAPEKTNRQLREVADLVHRDITSRRAVDPAPTDAEPEPPEPGFDVGIMAYFNTGSGVYGQAGSSTRIGGGLAAELFFGQGMFVELSAAALAGPWIDQPDIDVSTFRFEPGLALGKTWDVGPIAVGPLVTGSTPVYFYEMTLADGSKRGYRRWRPRGGLGFDLRWEVIEDLSFVVVRATAGVLGRGEEFHRVSNETTIMATPLVDWSALVGLVLSGG